MINMYLDSERIKKRRKELKLSQAQLAELVGNSQKAIAKWETGKTRRPTMLKELAEALRCSQDWLLGGQGSPSIPTRVPIISWVQAGDLVEAVEIPHEWRSWIDYPVQHNNMIALEVKGSSMNRVSPDGSVIIVDLRERDLIQNRLYVIRVGNETTYKRFRDAPARLEPDSTEVHETIFLREQQLEVHIIGRVVHSMMNFK